MAGDQGHWRSGRPAGEAGGGEAVRLPRAAHRPSAGGRHDTGRRAQFAARREAAAVSAVCRFDGQDLCCRGLRSNRRAPRRGSAAIRRARHRCRAGRAEAPAGAQHIRRAFEPQDIRGAFLVTAATDNHALNHEIYELCQRERIFISTADDRTACSFFFPAVRTGNGLSVGLVSDGSDHKKTARTAKKIEAILKEEQE